MSDSSKPERGTGNHQTVAPSSAPEPLFNTLPPQPADPASTVRAPSLSDAPSQGTEIILPRDPAPNIISVPPPATTAPPGAEHERELLLGRLRQRRERMSASDVAALFKLLE